MQKRKKFLLSIIIKHHCLPNKSPDFDVYINNSILKASGFDGTFSTYDALTLLGENSIKINFKNRSVNDTIVNDNNKVLHDNAVEIYKVTIDQHDVTHQIRTNFAFEVGSHIVNNSYGYFNSPGIGVVNFINPPFYWLRNMSSIKIDDLTIDDN